jgi:outer membrane protein assembly factor BamB
MERFRVKALAAGLLAAPLLAACGGSTPSLADGSAPAAASNAALTAPDDGDWAQWGRTPAKNMVSDAKNLPFAFNPGKVKSDDTPDLSTAKNVLWAVKMGSQTYGNPAVAKGRVYIGTNNEGRGDPRFKGDYSLVKCLDAATGKEIWTLTVPKTGTGKVGDWEFLGICSHPTAVDDRVYVMTNRCEVMCLDVHGLANGNQGDQDEAVYMSYVGTTPGKPVELKPTDADILWRYNMIQELAVFPHNITAGSPLIIGDILYTTTSNGVTYDHTDLPSPKAPALIALDRKAAERPGVKPSELLVGEEASGISKRIFHGAWTGPSWGEVGGKGVLFYGGPDGFLYAFDPKPVKDADGFGIFPELWRYDCNPPDFRYRNGDRTQPIKYASLGEGPSEIMATPVFYKGKLYAGIGQDPEHRARPGHFTCVDAATGKKVWDLRIGGTMSTCAIADDLVYVPDLQGWIYCLDAQTGRLYWKHDTAAEVWSSPLVADGKVYVGNADGVLTIFSTDRLKKLADEAGGEVEAKVQGRRLLLKKGDQTVREVSADEAPQVFQKIKFHSALHCSPVVAQGVLYVASFRHLYAIKAGDK